MTTVTYKMELSSDSQLFVPCGYFAYRGVPCFVELVFEKRAKKESNHKDTEFYSPTIDDSYVIEGFSPISTRHNFVPLPPEHAGSRMLRAKGDRVPVAAKMTTDEVIVARDFSRIRAALDEHIEQILSYNPFFSLGLSRLVNDSELEYKSAVNSFNQIRSTRPGLAVPWARNTILSDESRERLEQYVLSQEHQDASVEIEAKIIRRILLFGKQLADGLDGKVIEFEKTIFKIEGTSGKHEMGNCSDLAIAVYPPGWLPHPVPHLEYPHTHFIFLNVDIGRYNASDARNVDLTNEHPNDFRVSPNLSGLNLMKFLTEVAQTVVTQDDR